MKKIFKRLYNYIAPACIEFVCPVCGDRGVNFLPLPDFYKDSLDKHGFLYSLDDFETLNCSAYSCSSCGASDRDRLYALYVSKCFEQSEVASINMLDIAPSQPLTNYLKNTGRIKLRTADLMMPGVDDCIDITDMACYEEEAFDSFICSHVLEHVHDDLKAIRELYRVLTPGGWGILMVPVLLSISEIDEDTVQDDIGERWRRFAQDDHVRMYSRAGFIQRIKACGFKLRLYDQEYFGAEAFRMHGISDKSVLYVVSKPEYM